MKIYLSTWLFDQTLGESLTKHDFSKRLLSYHFIKQAKVSNSQVDEYCTTGKLKVKKS